MKKKSLFLILISLFLLVLTSCSSGDDKNITVFSEGVTEYSIVISSDASDDEKNLASELTNISGTTFEMFTDASEEKPCEIIIGDTNRAATAAMAEKLHEVESVYAIHYLIGESNGKIVIFSDADVGYVYALEHLKSKYISNGAFVIPEGTCDINRILWEDYLASELYYDRLLAEAEKNPILGGGTEAGDLTMEYWIERYKTMVADFDTASFGTDSSAEFARKNKYDAPAVYPTSGAHPRILFTENSIETVKENLNAKENYRARDLYIAASEAGCDGKFRERSENETHNFDESIVGKIEAMAYRYAMTGEEIYGYQALYAIKNAILTIDVTHDTPDWCRLHGYLMYVAACVYDWCYDLMTETDKTQLIYGCVNLLGKHLEIVCWVSDTNKVPSAQQVAYGHGAEDQLLVDYLSFAIACYDEAPEIYEFVAGRIYTEYVPAQNFLYDSGSPYEGTMYGAHRGYPTMMANILFNKMTDGKESPFTDRLEDVAITMINQIRPDGWVYRIGDINENKKEYDYRSHAAFWFLTANYYENSYLKSYAYKYLNNFTSFISAAANLTSIQFLALNNPDISYTYEGTAPLTTSTTYPYTAIYAKSENNNPNAFGVYMTMPENHVYSHAHAEAGSFQIYYKGALASDSGVYTSWGNLHHMGYNMSTISSNSLLVYNPNLAGTKNFENGNLVYSGGQTIAPAVKLPYTLEDIKAAARFNQCTSLGAVTVEQNGQYMYSYMGGDMTKAYDRETVTEVTRYMFAVATGNNECPLVFLTFDRVTSRDEDFHKAALIHVQNEPVITYDGYAIITNGGGKMIVQSVGEACEYVKWGGDGKEFWIPGVDENGNYSLEDGYNISSNTPIKDGSKAEYGWGRIEISPATPELTNHMLTVMYVTDAANNKTPTKADEIISDNLAGAVIFGKAVLFSKNENLLTKETSFELTAGADCHIAGVKGGTWQIVYANGETDTITVEDGNNLITFKANEAGTYTIKPVN